LHQQKTKPVPLAVDDFLAKVADENVRDDCYDLIKLMKKVTGEEPKMWGPSIVGFGQYHYQYASGHEGYSCLTGFSPRKLNITLYVMPGFAQYTDLLQQLGKHKAGKGCLYIKTLKDINLDILNSLILASIDPSQATLWVRCLT
jgi:hypothetical protein